jgi:hypothetical protein
MSSRANSSAVLRCADEADSFYDLKDDWGDWAVEEYEFDSFDTLASFRAENLDEIWRRVFQVWSALREEMSESLKDSSELAAIEELFQDRPYVLGTFLTTGLGDASIVGWTQAFDDLFEEALEQDLIDEDSEWMDLVDEWLDYANLEPFEATAERVLTF